MPDLRPGECPIAGGKECSLVFTYDAPPAGEIGFRRQVGDPYWREIWQFSPSNHLVSRHGMQVQNSYTGDYVDATYGGMDGMRAAFDRIVALPAGMSDNAGRIQRLRDFAGVHFSSPRVLRLLDIGAGLGVFPHAARAIGWECTALDPDPRAVDHIQNTVGVRAICADFTKAADLGSFDVLTFNKVLEHVEDPVAMLRHAHAFLSPSGFVYIELPDGEMAAAEGPGREEFFIEHLHIFSFASAALLANRAGFTPLAVERLREPSGKLTLRAFLVPEQRPPTSSPR